MCRLQHVLGDLLAFRIVAMDYQEAGYQTERQYGDEYYAGKSKADFRRIFVAQQDFHFLLRVRK
jgi:hypothetical protein